MHQSITFLLGITFDRDSITCIGNNPLFTSGKPSLRPSIEIT